MAMPRDRLLKDLAQAERNVAQSADSVSLQERIVSELTAAGRSELAAEARVLLEKFQDLQNADVFRRNQLRADLDVWDASD